MGEQGTYAIVQYVPDLERHESVNVGALIATTSGIWHRFVYSEHETIDLAVVKRFDELITHLVERELRASREHAVDGRGFLLELADRSFSHFEISAPRSVVLADEPERTLDHICERLVVAPTERFALP
jgi:Protein of unknown function (DUF3037)